MLNTRMIGNRISEARKRINISQAQLAQRLFISSQAVGKWERGESMPDIVTLNRLAEILGVDLNYFSAGLEPVTANSHLTVPDELPISTLTEQPAANQREKPKWDMSRGNWVDADFSGLKNLHEKFSSSNIQRCKFIGSDLKGLLLKGNHVVSCDFSESDLTGSHIQNTHLSNNIFKGSSIKDAEFSKSHMEGCDFSGADFTGAVFKTCSCRKNTLTDAVLNNTTFIGTDLMDIVFNGTLEDCAFENCSFKNVTFQNLKLTNTFFKNTDLKKIRFIDSYADRLTYEFLKAGKADLSGLTLLL